MKSSGQLIEAELPAIRNRVKLEDDTLYYIDEQPFRVHYNRPYLNQLSGLNDSGAPSLSPVIRLRKFEKHLTRQLYLRLFCSLKNDQEIKWPPLAEREQFMDTLSAANASSNVPDLLWRIENQQLDGKRWAVKNTLSRPLLEGTYAANESADGYVDFLREAESRRQAPDQYHAYCNAYLDPTLERYRIYLNLRSEAIPSLVATITSQFNFYKLPFRLICYNHPDLYTRPDNTLLLVNKNDLKMAERLLRPLITELNQALNPRVPMFCEPLAKGVGLAEDPGLTCNYGEYMMGLVAQRLISEHWLTSFDSNQVLQASRPSSFTSTTILI